MIVSNYLLLILQVWSFISLQFTLLLTGASESAVFNLAQMKTVYISTLYLSIELGLHTIRGLFMNLRSSQCSTTDVAKAVVCVILSVGWCI